VPIGRRLIDVDALLERVAPSVAKALRPWLAKQPRHEDYVSRQGAAKILGKNVQHLARIEERMPDPIFAEGSSWPLYVKSEVEDLRDALAAERKEKAKG
jgi:hypothetical protein